MFSTTYSLNSYNRKETVYSSSVSYNCFLLSLLFDDKKVTRSAITSVTYLVSPSFSYTLDSGLPSFLVIDDFN